MRCSKVYGAWTVFEAPHEKWHWIDEALRQRHRGLAGGSSLLKLLAKKRGLRNPLNLPLLTETQVLTWANLHRQRPGSFPKYKSGAIVDAPGETWGRGRLGVALRQTWFLFRFVVGEVVGRAEPRSMTLDTRFKTNQRLALRVTTGAL
jgi:hypothetical protein